VKNVFTFTQNIVSYSYLKVKLSNYCTETSEERLALDIFYLHTKLGNSRFSHSGDMIAGVEIKNESCDPNHTPFRGGLLSKARI